ncbi:hypothetical protein LTR02_001595 [Friedmanniomyces endolithicus]|nr:hypothetical protein LTR94_010748 [Friedmanniomyces endolithicus]KAK0793171.1 hypothetical protein LTR38_009648 [Friedmanniomyces endolithicus]KAK0800933.1 hypothetical protein LTR75_008756 [Friedmanniomyces endolithicus]KAK0810986.1 hypothetical protein LTR59_001997 [Friedmanniomyces endolithicus]KAK0856178.1 hypothetical protein LTS02_010777 [Friedmanniomyces endolithicus]
MDYLIRFLQVHETFRQPETEALARLAGVQFEWIFYADHSPYSIIRFRNCSDPTAAAKSLISRSILSTGIFELWGTGVDYAALHADIRARTETLWPRFTNETFRFKLDIFHGSHTLTEHRAIIETFKYMAFTGPIQMKNPTNKFDVFEDHELDAPIPRRLFFGRQVAESGRRAMNKYDLKKRSYIATTSMDAELSLVTANLAQVAPGTLMYDPFMGTGSFPLACAHFGAAVFGSDLDGRSIRGNKPGRNVKGNFEQYGTSSQYLGGFVADLTNSPVRQNRILQAIVCDPPYGVREGLKVLGSTRAALQEVVYLADTGLPAHLQPNYVPPKKAYSFFRMLDDILHFAAERLEDDGRLCMWMPVAGEVEGEEAVVAVPESDADTSKGTAGGAREYDIPRHPALRLVSVCTQDFNKWSRQLLTYRRVGDGEVDGEELGGYEAGRAALRDGEGVGSGATANDLNEFRKKYFQGFKERS